MVPAQQWKPRHMGSSVLDPLCSSEELISPESYEGWNFGVPDHIHFILPKGFRLQIDGYSSKGPLVAAQQVMQL